MSLLFETIACIDGRLQSLKWHQARLNRSFTSLYKATPEIVLEDIQVPEFANAGLWKCRVTFDSSHYTINFEPYTRLKIQTLKLIESGISYSFKFSDRTEILELFQKRGNADDILIIKDGMVMDSSKANVMLFDGNEWFTPEQPLLPGTMRAQLLEEGKIKAKPIYKTDLAQYQKIMLVSAMNPFDELRALKLPEAILD